jgi:cytochrome c biogenesis protein CcdA
VVIPLAFALVSIWGLRLGLYQVDVAVALYVIGLLTVSLAIAFLAAAILRRAEREVRSAEQAGRTCRCATGCCRASGR